MCSRECSDHVKVPGQKAACQTEVQHYVTDEHATLHAEVFALRHGIHLEPHLESEVLKLEQ
jgi:hypothetical protein